MRRRRRLFRRFTRFLLPIFPVIGIALPAMADPPKRGDLDIEDVYQFDENGGPRSIRVDVDEILQIDEGSAFRPPIRVLKGEASPHSIRDFVSDIDAAKRK